MTHRGRNDSITTIFLMIFRSEIFVFQIRVLCNFNKFKITPVFVWTLDPIISNTGVPAHQILHCISFLLSESSHLYDSIYFLNPNNNPPHNRNQ